MYAHSNELEEEGVINLNAVNVESNPDMEMLLGVRLCLSTSFRLRVLIKVFILHE